MPATQASTALRFVGLTRKSKGEDEGTHADQERIIRDRCEREGFTLVRIDREHNAGGEAPLDLPWVHRGNVLRALGGKH